MSKFMDHANRTAMEMVKQISAQKEALIMEQLNELISRGLLVVEQTEPVLIEEYDPMTNLPRVEFKQSIKLKLKDQEYIEQLERRVERAEAFMKKCQEIAND